MTSGGAIRIFVAVELSAEMRAAAGDAARAIDALRIRGARTARSDGAHVTLRFLGDVERRRVADVERAMALAAAGSEPFELRLAEGGAFPNVHRARVVWLGVDGDTDSLARLRRELEDRLADAGFGRERRRGRFEPHVTLARIRDSVGAADRRRIARLMSRGDHARAVMRVEFVSLMQSTLRPSGATYERLSRRRLGVPRDAR